MPDKDSNTSPGAPSTDVDEQSNHYGLSTVRMVGDLFADSEAQPGINRAVLLMRHSARYFDRDIHDLLNPLTDHGRQLCDNFGSALPSQLLIRGYSSPAERCIETSQLIIDSHKKSGGRGHTTHPLEALGVFYALDQRRMWKGLTMADGLADYVGRWFAGEVGREAMMPAPIAVELLLDVLIAKLAAPAVDENTPQLDLCVSHDMTIFTMRHGLGLEPVTGPTVEFLDGLLMYEASGVIHVRSCYGGHASLQKPTG